MGKRNHKAKRTLSSLPKGLVRRQGNGDPGNPFEMTARFKRPKHEVHNRPVTKPKSTKHALESLQRRQKTLRSNIKDSKKANTFIDRRIGEFDAEMSQDDRMLARLVKERTRQSSKSSKFRLEDEDDNDGFLTHKGSKLDPSKSEVMYSDDEDEHGGNLEAVDTELHFGGAGLSSMGSSNPYGNSLSNGTDLSKLYGQTRKVELDDLIARRKAMKAEKMEKKETQIDTFEKMDETFGELSELLRYRKNEKRPLIPPKPTQEDREMNEWNSELREMMSKPKRRATDRTKTPEEIAKEESEHLHELETRRLARMNGDFEEDDCSDISVGNTRKKKSKRQHRNPDELSDSDDDENDGQEEVKFTADGKRIEGNKKVEHSDSDDDESDTQDESCHPLTEGTRVRGNYRAADQFEGRQNWYEGKIIKVHESNGNVTYDVEYDDGDTEERVIPKNVRPFEEIQKVEKKIDESKNAAKLEQLKRKKARAKARYVAFSIELPRLRIWCFYKFCRT
jgi:nucleolar protein 14